MKDINISKVATTHFEDFVADLIEKFQNHIDGVKVRNDMFPPATCLEWARINHCQAWFTRVDCFTFVKSYDTIVAMFDGYTLYSYGRYSNTTYQHIRKFRNNYTSHSWATPENNLERVNWYR